MKCWDSLVWSLKSASLNQVFMIYSEIRWISTDKYKDMELSINITSIVQCIMFSKTTQLMQSIAQHINVSENWIFNNFVFFDFTAQPATVSFTLRTMLQSNWVLLKSIQTPEQWQAPQKSMLSAVLSVWWANQTTALLVWLNAIMCLQSKSLKFSGISE